MQIKVIRILALILLFMFGLNGFLINVSKEQITAQVSVQPSSQTVGQADVFLPTPQFAVNITVSDVGDLYGWQIVLYYNSTILLTAADWITVPTENVFKDKQFTFFPPSIGKDSKGNYTIVGATLLGVQAGFSGSGLLCQVKFKGETTGTASLNLGITTDSGYSAELLNSNLDPITISTADGQVTVVGIEKLTINVAPNVVIVGSNAIVSGNIYLTSSGLNITISYKVAENETWNKLATVRTDADGHYTYPWNTSEVEPNFYELKASWPGNADDPLGAQSIKVQLTVKKASRITISARPQNVSVGSKVIINGSLYEIYKGTSSKLIVFVNVTVYYKSDDEQDWRKLATVRSDVGNYVYGWATNASGTFQVKTSWLGSELIAGAESDVQTVEVTGVTPPPEEPLGIMAYLPYIIAAVAIIAVLTIGVYFKKLRKR